MDERDRTSQSYIELETWRQASGADKIEPRDEIPRADKLAKLYEMARDCPIISQCMGMRDAGRWSLDDALFHAVESLSAQNKAAQNRLIEIARRTVSVPPIFMP